MKLQLAAVVMGMIAAAGSAMAGPFTEGNLVVSRVGGVDDDLANAPNSAARVRLIEISPVDGTIINEVRLPALASEVAGSNNHRLTLNTDFRAGLLHRSVNGLYLVMGGYDADAGTPDVTRTQAETVARVVARIDAHGAVDTITAIHTVSTVTSGDAGVYEGANGSFRSVATVDGTHFWLAGGHSGSGSDRRGRVQHALYGATTSNHVPTGPGGGGEFVDARAANIFFGQLYGVWNRESVNLNQHRGLYTIGTGIPTLQGALTVNTPKVYDEDGVVRVGSPYDFFFLDEDTVYLCNDDFPSDNGGILKFVRDTVPESPTFGMLTYRYTLNAGLPAAVQTVRAVTGRPRDGGGVELFAITAANAVGGTRGNSLVTVIDTGCPTGAEEGCLAADTFTTLATAGDLEIYRGVAFAPRPCVGDECIGACCQPGATCAEATAATCTGVFRGVGTTCAMTVCAQVCRTPFADADGDDDVDLDDFAQFQRCYSGNGVPVTGDCTCFDRPELPEFPGGDGDVDMTDFNAFVACESRAGVPSPCSN